ncbi:MAG: restriction endonuclease [Bacteroidetes bacterium]|nr:restriction endonuclease [Bacteroidota bacterium]
MGEGTLNHLYYGDNLDILRTYIADDSVDLIYLDPPFNSKRNYNQVFTGKGGQKAAAQIQAFEDTWRWDESAARAYDEVVIEGNHAGAASCLKAFREMLGTNDMLAYLSMMAVRLVELRRVLKPTGSIYLHCDPTMSAHLRLVLDSIFGAENFLNEIVWKRTGAHNSAIRYGPVHDVILYYSRSKSYIWNQGYVANQEYVDKRYTQTDPQGRRFYPVSLLAAGTRAGRSGDDWRGISVRSSGNHWRYTVDKLDELDEQGDIYWPANGGKPRLKMYLENAKGQLVQDWWDDIPPINSQAAERLGYPTQKPEALLERIINASSNEGDVVLDPFCGCGTAVAVAQKLNRKWIGIDITHLAVNLIRTRLVDSFGDQILKTFKVIGEPTTLEDAIALAQTDNEKYQFQFWALGLVGARPEVSDQKKGADKGIDGKRFFSDEMGGSTKSIIISVKGGLTIPANAVRDLRGTIEREKAEIGVLISIAEPTKNMREDAAAAGFYTSAFGTKHPRLQLLTIEQLLGGKGIDMPSQAQQRRDVQTIKKAKKDTTNNSQEQLGL